MRARYRITQFIRHLNPPDVEQVDAEFQALVTPEQWQLVAPLAQADRAHLLTVYRWLEDHGCQDPDVLMAGLLHDVGKADSGRPVGVIERIVIVLLRRPAPGLLRRLAYPKGNRWRQGLYLALEHPRIGAERVRNIGGSERLCWLIANHHVHKLDDPGLRLLQRADAES